MQFVSPDRAELSPPDVLLQKFKLAVDIELLRKNYHNREDFKRQNNGSAE
jgi:hypothetical protein